MAISRQQFLGLEPGKHVVVVNGNKFTVERNDPTDPFSDIPGPREVVLRTPGGTHFGVGWMNGTGIVDDTWGKFIDLNHPDAFVLDVS